MWYATYRPAKKRKGFPGNRTSVKDTFSFFSNISIEWISSLQIAPYNSISIINQRTVIDIKKSRNDAPTHYLSSHYLCDTLMNLIVEISKMDMKVLISFM